MSNDLNQNSMIDKDTRAIGLLKTQGNLVIHGTLQGTIIAQNHVWISKQGKVEGEIHTREARIEGRVQGPIQAIEKITLTENCQVESDIVSPSLKVEPGCSLTGFLVITPDSEERQRWVKERHLSPSPSPEIEPSFPFRVTYPDVQSIRILGDFCDWKEPDAIPLESAGNGIWTADLHLSPGRYEYLLIVDGQSVPDPCNAQKVPNAFGGENSILMIP